MNGARKAASHVPRGRGKPPPGGKKPTLFLMTYFPYHKPGVSAETVLSDETNPRYVQVKRAIDSRDRNGLWWSVAATMSISPKRTVRSWCARRLRNAFKEELAARGLNEMAQRVVDGKVEQEAAPIQGTLRMLLYPQVLTARYAKIQEEAGGVVDSLLAGAQHRRQAASVAGFRGRDIGKKFDKGGRGGI